MAFRIAQRINRFGIRTYEVFKRPKSQNVQHNVASSSPLSGDIGIPTSQKQIKELPENLVFDMDKTNNTKEIMITSLFRGRVPQKIDKVDLILFEKALQGDRSKQGFINVVYNFRAKDKQSRGHLSFLYAALIYIDKFGLEKDLDVYNEMIDAFPKYKFINRTLLDALWPKPHPQIDCAIDLLTKMEDNYVRPDNLTYTILMEVFGRASVPVQKIQRMAYWFDKYKDINPYLLPEEDLKDRFKVCKSAMQRMTNDSENIKVYVCEESDNNENEKSFLMGSQTLEQQSFISTYDTSNSLYVEGPFNIWMNNIKEQYFVLRTGCLNIANPETHEDDTRVREGMILGVCMSNKPISGALKNWLQYIELDNPKFIDFNIIFNVDIPDEIALRGPH